MSDDEKASSPTPPWPRAGLCPGENRLDFRVFESQEQAFGQKGSIEKVGRLRGAYLPKSRAIGHIASHLSSARDAERARQTLAH